jgi:23S rRNA (guanosine2251-2'-O)-methyltransferase
MSHPPRKPGGPPGRTPGGPTGSRPSGGARSGTDAPRSGRPSGPHQGPRPQGRPDSRFGEPRTGEARPQGRTEGPRPYQNRPDGPRPPQTRTEGPRPYQNRPDGPRPPQTRTEGPRPYQNRPDGPRPPQTRTEGPRPYQNRPDGPRPPQTRTDAPRPRPDNPRPPQARTNDPRPAPLRMAEPRPSQPHLPETPRGTVWLYGIHAIEAALGNPARRLRRLILTEEAEAALLERRPLPWPLSPERTERSRIDQLLGRDTVHQGAALLADPLASPLLAQVLERPGVVIVLDQVVDPRNIGAVLRSAAAFGAACLITQDRNAPEETGALAKAASGALETVPLLRAVNLARTLVALKAAGFWTVGLDAGGAPLRGTAMAGRRVALVLGAEGAGLRRLVRETCDEVAGLQMPGSMESLNVSAAATVALYEMSRPA